MRSMKRVLAAGLAAVMAVAMAAGCGKSGGSGDETYKIGILQFAEHGSLDNCRKGFLKGLEKEGMKEGDNLEVTYQNFPGRYGNG